MRAPLKKNDPPARNRQKKMNGLEIEVKFFVRRPAPLRRRILDLGARTRGRVFEHNALFDDRRRTLTARGALLRLRTDSAHRLTYKTPAEESSDQFKVLHELETTVADAAVVRRILAGLGFAPVRSYEKWRETFILDAAHLCLDRLPYGHFLEIEGDGDTIRRLAAALGFEWHRRILGTYQDLFRIVAEQEGLGFEDITFANFAGLTIDLAPLQKRFEAGEG